MVEWSSAFPNGAEVLDYEVDMAPGGIATDFFQVYKGKKNHTLQVGLYSEGLYGFRVRPRNAFGIGPWSNQYNIITLPPPKRYPDGTLMPDAISEMSGADLAKASVPFGRAKGSLVQSTSYPKQIHPYVTAPISNRREELMKLSTTARGNYPHKHH